MATFPLPDYTNLSLLQPGVAGEQADYSAGDYTFTNEPRYIKCSALGILKVDLLDGGTGVDLPVVPGVNPERVTKIYNVGSDSMTVLGLR
jgi:hypothetical protein